MLSLFVIKSTKRVTEKKLVVGATSVLRSGVSVTVTKLKSVPSRCRQRFIKNKSKRV